MTATIQKWGNSLALRIPRAVAQQIKVSEGEPVELSVDADALVVRPARRRYRLADLLRRVKPENVHPETDWGQRVGRDSRGGCGRCHGQADRLAEQ
jgi:antitoxin MazE